ncbi:low molecular weight protein-tyrosine-phosphatase [Marinobacter salicampi]|uniref:low molecular weight protein-tyrosine-phosphatase n=1 Tax=Marinobacter salicampi TaxID=435907 RepID=UPI001407F45F|nr:low molecular weight protein-tyrosine-phosphatase [Marinobacter salicampi]
MTKPINVLFVCLGNICRSPSAQGVFEKVVADAGLCDQIQVDSCGTTGFHSGSSPDPRAVSAAARRNITIGGLRAREFDVGDLKSFDYVLAMDTQNLLFVKEAWHLAGGTQPELFLSYAAKNDVEEVPDPYYGGDQGFEKVLDLIDEASQGLLRHIRERHL